MELFSLAPARVSLEFTAVEWPLISQRLQQFGILQRQSFSTFDQLRIGREDFVLTDDGEELALISQSAAGDMLLKRVFHNLGPGFSASMYRNSFRARRQLSARWARRAA